ncbi:ABC transporter permease [Actinomyces sp. oral taxon 171]|uniref:ABC transporter permease n=1 Tax=Actinomyces sp. oral taxon 171 TaxID=706438 RepID=UPI0001F62056|nr:FtsX-like permease family protein [Actinomyces sp. oral taxon 171]EFW27785.1 efflux ABC transporter, permease protein [Actinomyces sp. oral taxon 171 str. F0337]QCT32739.1 ABC transporter permease [Actinomyces sp. oral taxon 171 str. F0337]
MNGILTGFFGAIVEAWAQLRIGKLRVLLSLVGVAAAVAAMTFVIALGQVSVDAINKVSEKYTGRQGTVTINVSPTGKGLDQALQADDAPEASTGGDSGSSSSDSGSSDAGGAGGSGGSGGAGGAGAPGGGSTTSAATAAKISGAMNSFVERYEVKSWATTYTSNVRFSFPDGARSVPTQTVSLSYGLLHHKTVSQGRWFTAQDEDDLSPSMVVTQGFLEALGIQQFTEPVTVTSFSPVQTSFTIVGVLEAEDLSLIGCSGDPERDAGLPCTQPVTAFALNTPYEHWLPKDASRPAPTLEIWAGQDGAKEIAGLAKKDLDARFGQGSTQTEDNLQGSGMVSSANTFTQVVTAAGVFVMLLGALSLVNISLVTVRQRIHEIGVRRSFGATSRRIFFSIMLESVVATVVAGVIGIGIAIVGMRVMPLSAFLGIPVTTTPPFPMMAAVIGLVAATAVGALAGIIPAIVATRIRPIDAIRY